MRYMRRLSIPRRDERRRDPATQEPPAWSQPEVVVASRQQSKRRETVDRRRIERLFDPCERQRLVQAEPEHDPLYAARALVERLQLPRRLLAPLERRAVAREARRVAPAAAVDGGDGADPDPEVVPRVPVGEVVARAEIALGVGAAEVRRLVPAVAGARQTLDDTLEVAFQVVALPLELGAVRDGEARARLSLELVAGEVLQLQREGLLEIGVEVGGALTRDPVDEIQRDVVKSGITEMVHGAPDVVRPGTALEHLEEARGERLRAERDPRDAGASQQRGQLLRDRLGIALDRHLL